MDPLLFGIDGEVVLEVLGTIVLIALIIERALSMVFEWRPLVPILNNQGLKGADRICRRGTRVLVEGL